MSKKKNSASVLVVGGGASGMMAAITAARRGRSVLVLEQMEKPGKKLYATGNGRCNFTNRYMDRSCYHGDPALYDAVSAQFSVEDTLSFFREIGVYPTERNGYVYPRSMQAASVAEALVRECSRCGVTMQTGAAVTEIRRTARGFAVVCGGETYMAEHVIAALGLCAAPKLGGSSAVFSLLKAVGHHFTPVLPALCGFTAEGMEFRKVSGVRCLAALTLVIDGEETAAECGELQLTDYGVSGIPVFQLSAPAARALYDKKNVRLLVDFLPELSKEERESELLRRIARAEEPQELLGGLVNSKLIPMLLKKADIRTNEALGQSDCQRLLAALGAYPVTLLAVRDFSGAQVCTGGVHTEELDIHTLESRLVPGLYFAGELLDVDGICGGYNLQWAWASGFVAGSMA